MNNLRTGDIFVCKRDTFISRAIRWMTKSTWSHTASFAVIEGFDCIIEAQRNGVNIKTYDNWVKEYGYIFEVYRNPDMGSERAFVNRSLQKAGVTGYDLISFLIRHPWKIITGSWRKMPIEEEAEEMVCSEFNSWQHRIKGWWQTTPDELHKYMVENGWKKIDVEG